MVVVVVVVVVVAGGAVVEVGASEVSVVDGTLVSTGSAVVGTAASVVDVAAVEAVGTVVVVVVVGGPIATGVSTTLSRIPATAVDAMNTETTVAPIHAAPIPIIRLIRPSMPHPAAAWVKPGLSVAQLTS